jgi:TPR repeat protein
MRLAFPAIPFALVVVSASFVLSITGCVSSFANASGYDEQACVERSLRRTPDPETIGQARQQLSEECRRGGAEACSVLGVIHELGLGVPANAARAVALYERACHDGNRRGCANLGIARAEGIGGPVDLRAAAQLLEPACAEGDARGCARLAAMRESGAGVSKDLRLAAPLFDLACSGEEASACVSLGDLRMQARQFDSAMVSYGEGCLHGDEAACARLAGSTQGTRRRPEE